VARTPKPDIRSACFNLRLGKRYHGPLVELAARNRRTMTAEVELALERHLQEQGLWPPPGEPGKKGK
jgi:hypothetical protein